ncbi:penicillin-binding protein activator [Methylophaga thalassica]|uniref:penicillin-binding protein activator n=1 Tax=Methylophaga aminisulfidivorans TaxID=230105 RepID=UPI003A8F8240
MFLKRSFWLSAIILLSLTACQPVQSPVSMTKPAQIETVASELSGQYQQAADEYAQLATTNDGAEQAAYQLKAAQMYWQSGQVELSQSQLDQIKLSLLDKSRRYDAAILGANIALFNSEGERALEALSAVQEKDLSAQNLKNVLKLKADAYTLTGNWLEKANTHLKLEKILTDPESLKNNREALWQALMQMTPQALDLFNPGYPPAEDSGWFALAYNIKAYQDNPEVLAVALEDWKRSYPNHPADPALYQKTLAAGTHIPKDIENIAVLLPNSGPFVEAAKAIKDAIIAAQYVNGSTAQLHFYDIQTDAISGQSNVLSQYDAAVADGAGVVIGPLQKSSVETLATHPNLSVPVLALNRTDGPEAYKNLYQFGLAPEDEAAAAANYAKQLGYKRSIVLAPYNDWGQRIASAFTNQWRKDGGTTLLVSNYNEAENDFRDTLIPLMGLNESEQRYKSLQGTLGRSLDFEPRRREGVDFLFLVARPLKARQLVPQLKYHRSGQLPLLATSHVYSGQSDPQQNIDLNDLIICDIPWVFEELAAEDPVYQALKNQSPENFASAIRLYALGVDAYKLIPQLNKLSRDPTSSMAGTTGTLSINSQGHVIRKMLWAKFEQGELKLIK